jgi:hypothetical protein
MEKVELRADIKYLCKKGMSPKDIQKDFMDTLGKESPSYSTEKKMDCFYFRGTGRALEMMSGLGGQKSPPTMKLPKLCTIWSCATKARPAKHC